MKHITLTKKKFSRGMNGEYELACDKDDLVRGVIAAGEDVRIRRHTKAKKADISMRVNAVESALDMSGDILKPTPEFQQSGSTSKAGKSFFVGNALTAHAAYKELGIPWLMDVETLATAHPRLRVETRGTKRSDYLGRDTRGNWYSLESKGRSERPTPGLIKIWKKQARSIRKVNGKDIHQHIVSAAYLNHDGEWELLWVDPPAGRNATFLEFNESNFFQFYYREIVALLANAANLYISPDGLLAHIPRENIYVGLHHTIIEALLESYVALPPIFGPVLAPLTLILYLRRYGQSGIIEQLPISGREKIVAFASSRTEDGRAQTALSGGVRVFADGILLVSDPGPDIESLLVRLEMQPANPDQPQTEDETPMSQSGNVGKSERETQNRVLKLFREELGYRYLGDWSDRTTNSNIDENLLTAHLAGVGYSPGQISRAIHALRIEADNPNRSLYENNKAVYSLLRYGVQVKTEAGKVTDTIHVINWKQPGKNDFAIAEEVTLLGGLERRPDLVLYVNGIAVAVVELKNSHVSMSSGIRQLLSNQQKMFNEWFFTTVQVVFAGNDSEGLRYGTIGTEEKYFLKWKEDEADNTRFKLDKYLLKMCRKDRLIELLHDFVVFDGGYKKLPRVHQYFGAKAAQAHVDEYKGGIIWHTQGSGKSIVMVLLAKWILENKPNARVLILTDRDELDKQIERVFMESGEGIYRTSSGHDLIAQLGQAKPRLLCSLVHKFGRRGVEDFDAFIEELKKQPSPAVGDLFVFVDECHRTQSGKLHRTMKAMLPGAVFIGFTGTPLLKQDKATSLEVFGGYIHTYKFNEGVEDGVILDLVYEARDIEQTLGSQDKIDAWFDAKTRGLNDWQKAALREQWGTMQKVLSSRSRMDRVVQDIVFDFGVKPRLSSERGNAILVVSSIYEACKYFELFQKTILKGRCAVVTSYNPQAQDVTLEETGANTETEKQFLYNTYTALLKDVDSKPGKNKTETYEDDVKELFKKQPVNMRLLVVVDKLLTGFDAPPCTYLYIDKSMQDHGLFQAICRTNRLDGDDKPFGYIVDYKDLFKKVQGAIAVYTSELDDSAGGGSPEILMQDRLKKGRERLDETLEAVALLCEPVQPPNGELEHIHYFCGNTELPDDLKEHETQRVALYKSTAALMRAYANIADDLPQAGYTDGRITQIKEDINRCLKLRDTIRQASGETIDLKAYEADMRHLIDTYIEAEEPRRISDFGEIGLLDLIVKSGITDAINSLPAGIRGNRAAVAETIANNVRSKIIKEHINDPAFYDRMSALLKEILADLKAARISYEEFLKRIAEAAKNVQTGKTDETPKALNTPAKRALFNNLQGNEELALKIDETVRRVKPNAFRGNKTKENVIKGALLLLLDNNQAEVERIFLIIEAHTEY